MEFACKLMELKKTILTEVTQAQKDESESILKKEIALRSSMLASGKQFLLGPELQWPLVRESHGSWCLFTFCLGCFV